MHWMVKTICLILWYPDVFEGIFVKIGFVSSLVNGDKKSFVIIVFFMNPQVLDHNALEKCIFEKTNVVCVCVITKIKKRNELEK